MKLFGDWKFFLTLFIALAGIAIPVWLWQADLSSKSLSVKLNTRVSLQPKEQESLPGIEISVDGSRLENPHLVVFEVTNDGSKPILATDFESPLDIRLESKTSFVRSQVTGTIPKDIEATILSERQRISLKPTLLNPKDTIAITAITSGASPIFVYNARVVGISHVSLEDSTIEKTSKARLAWLLSGSVLSYVAMIIMFHAGTDAGVRSKDIFIRPRAAIFVCFVSGFPGVVAFGIFFKGIGIEGLGYYMFFSMILWVTATFIAIAINRKPAIIDVPARSE
ncbi:MAG: hypothetical protein NTY00_06115 [Deltaproteobacteria bacterium]|nr:hypothetical protein [Deltaproteobacteria bacterium]